jgi:putative hydrolase of HD superfamily
MLLADLFVSHGIEVDIQKVLRLALVHDWAEVRVGDMPKTASAYFGKEARKRAETAAFADVVSELAEAKNYTELYDDYEQRRSLEARIVKVADVVDLLVEALALERAGHRGLNEFWQVAEERNFDLDGLARQLVDEILDALLKARNELHKSTLADK